MFDDLVAPGRPTHRPWLHLLDGEIAPRVLMSERTSVIVWSSLWPARPDVRVRFDLTSDGADTDLRFTLLLDPPHPDEDEIRRMRKRLERLINVELRHTYGQ
ncbi:MULTISPECIES: hypothetical protein [unclassified Rhodococcus (in: high G+C Gram-positive bacteria)]|uniref:hypothetical protein n=1 Tax=unclassified Rhodococcus (in: high G+C Gram-positive bacteria) TaxID=192944 RepID=UPI0027E1430F|nr:MULTISPECIES: hypothetical protein [unclassified Rhodococcus (in: high G+C Gram-positive bacteria)]